MARGDTVKDKMRKIMYECFPFDPDFGTCFVDETRIEIAINQIEKLFKKQNPGLYTDWAGLDPVKWDGYDPYADTILGEDAQELNMSAVRCDCRHCQPEKWEKDDRGIWIRIFQTE